MQSFAPVLLMGAGAFSATAAIMDWDFFMNSRRARLFVSLFGRNGARIFYVVLGVGLAIGGVVFASQM